jgi:hypothetical protein
MRLITQTILFFTLISIQAWGQERAELTQPPNGDNQRSEISQWIGPVKITIDYHSPDVHAPDGSDRTGHIWGELVSYGFTDPLFGPSTSTPWRAGANETTTISFSHDVRIGDNKISKGTYGLFLDVEKDGTWNWIISNDIGWGSFQYNPKDDVLRIAAPAKEAPYTEWLSYGFENRLKNSATAFLQWENKKVSLKIDVPNVDTLYVDQLRRDLNGWAGFTRENWMSAARFCAQTKINLDEALLWADKAIEGPFRGVLTRKETCLGYTTKAMVLNAMGKVDESAAIMDRAIRLPDATPVDCMRYVRLLIRTNRKEKAMEVATFSAKNFATDKFYTSLGLAYSYAALSDRKNTVKYADMALANIPVDQKGNSDFWMSEMQRLKKD